MAVTLTLHTKRVSESHFILRAKNGPMFSSSIYGVFIDLHALGLIVEIISGHFHPKSRHHFPLFPPSNPSFSHNSQVIRGLPPHIALFITIFSLPLTSARLARPAPWYDPWAKRAFLFHQRCQYDLSSLGRLTPKDFPTGNLKDRFIYRIPEGKCETGYLYKKVFFH